jgi:hypothetical protein
MLAIPSIAQPLAEQIAPTFTDPTFDRFMLLMLAHVLATGRHTVSRMLRDFKAMLWGHWSSFHRVFSQARWSTWPIALFLARKVVALVPADRPLLLVADDTVETRNGDHVHGASIHRDPLASSRKLARFRRGLKWATLAAVIQLPLVPRPWALPLLTALVCQEKVDRELGRRHHTVRQRVKQMLIRMMRWFPDRKFILVGDWGVSCHELAEFAVAHAGRITVIARMRKDTCLHAPPAEGRRCKGGLAKKGKRLPSPEHWVKSEARTSLEIDWYGQGKRQLQCVSDTALWYCKHRNAVVPIRWVWSSNPATGNEDYFYSTDCSMAAKQIIEWYINRWPIEVTFQMVREHLGVEQTRHWCEESVMRVTACQFGLFTAVGLLYAQLVQSKGPVALQQTPCYQKDQVTFSDALAAVRREIWEGILPSLAPQGQCQTTLPPEFRTWLLDRLCAAA